MDNTNAPLVEAFMAECVMLEKKRVPDGVGGFSAVFEEGETFRAAIVKDGSAEDRSGEKQGVISTYTVTTPVGVSLDYHEVFRRMSDGATFRVTGESMDSRPPTQASFAFEQVTAERWNLPA